MARFTDLEILVRLDNHEVFSGPWTLGGVSEIDHGHEAIQKASDSPKDFP